MQNISAYVYCQFLLYSLCNSAYFTEDLTINFENPLEEHTVILSCKISDKCSEEEMVRWSKFDKEVRNIDRIGIHSKGRLYWLEIKNCNIFDSGRYSIDVNGRKRSVDLDIKGLFLIL